MSDEGGGASRSTEPASGTSAATDVSLREHLAQRLHETERRLDQRFLDLRKADERFYEERDRRYSEVNIEKEKALKIKETADLAALGLAREIQQYKDEKANELREQINSERGLYPTRIELATVVDQIKRLESFQSRILGALALAIVVIPGVVYLLTSGTP